MKILLVNKFHYIKGGSETYYFSLAEALKRQGHQVIFFAMKSEQNFPCDQSNYFVDNVDYNGKQTIFTQIKISFKIIYSLEAKRKFERLIIDEKPDIVHLNLVKSQITLSIVDVCK